MPIPGITSAPLLIVQNDSVSVSDLFNVSTWSGSASNRTITTGVDGSKGTMVWIKSTNQSYGHVISDTKIGGGYYLSSNSPNAVSTSTNFINSFGSNGYSIGDGTLVNGSSSSNYVGWQFRSGANFFDVVEYIGNGTTQNIAHSIGSAPGMIIVKRRDLTSNWQVYHSSYGPSQYAVLNSPAGFISNSNRWNGVNPTSSVFTVGDDSTVNASGGSYVAYVFGSDSSANGIIRAGSITASGSTISVSLGWRPQFVIIRMQSGDPWLVNDAMRGVNSLHPETASPQNDYASVSFNSTGFTMNSFGSGVNGAYLAVREL